ncbi:MAG: hypothetical protein ACTS4V_00820 [Candidatus Hodgkinia cicadicola]
MLISPKPNFPIRTALRRNIPPEGCFGRRETVSKGRSFESKRNFRLVLVNFSIVESVRVPSKLLSTSPTAEEAATL